MKNQKLLPSIALILLLTALNSIFYTQALLAANEDIKLDPNAELENGKISVDPEGSYNRDIQIGGEENGATINPDAKLENGEISIDPKIDYKKAQKYLTDKVVSYISGKIKVPNFLTELYQDFQTISGDISTFLSERNIKISQGDIGLPNIQEAKVIFSANEELDKVSDLFGTQTNSTFSNKDKLLQQYLKDLSQEYAENSALSLEGQSKIEQKIATVDATVEQSLALSDDSSGQDVSQNILRNISNQLSLQQQIDAMGIFEMQEDKIARNLNLQMNSESLSEISQQTTLKTRENIAANREHLRSIYAITIPGKRD
jgi:hypothetical protein